MKTWFRIVLACLLSLPAVAGTTGDHVALMQVNGKVLDQQTAEELTGVEVRVAGTDIVTYTDFDGHFSFTNLPAGNYTLEFRFVTYKQTQVISDDADHQLSLTVELASR